MLLPGRFRNTSRVTTSLNTSSSPRLTCVGAPGAMICTEGAYRLPEAPTRRPSSVLTRISSEIVKPASDTLKLRSELDAVAASRLALDVSQAFSSAIVPRR